MVATSGQHKIFTRHGTAMRLFALFVGFWMIMLPQMLNARVMSTPDEYGNAQAPVNEEEIKHVDLFELVVSGKAPHQMLDRSSWTKCCKDCPVLAPRGDVPHPPPW